MPVHPVADHRQRQVEKGRRLDQPHAAAQVEVDDRRLERRLAGLWIRLKPCGTVDPERSPEPVDRRLDRRRAADPAAPKNPSIPARPIASTISTEPIPLAIAPTTYGYRSRCVGAERGVAQVFGPERGQIAHHPGSPRDLNRSDKRNPAGPIPRSPRDRGPAPKHARSSRHWLTESATAPLHPSPIRSAKTTTIPNDPRPWRMFSLTTRNRGPPIRDQTGPSRRRHVPIKTTIRPILAWRRPDSKRLPKPPLQGLPFPGAAARGLRFGGLPSGGFGPGLLAIDPGLLPGRPAERRNRPGIVPGASTTGGRSRDRTAATRSHPAPGAGQATRWEAAAALTGSIAISPSISR